MPSQTYSLGVKLIHPVAQGVSPPEATGTSTPLWWALWCTTQIPLREERAYDPSYISATSRGSHLSATFAMLLQLRRSTLPQMTLPWGVAHIQWHKWLRSDLKVRPLSRPPGRAKLWFLLRLHFPSTQFCFLFPFPFLPIHWCWSQEHPIENLLHVNLVLWSDS